MMKKQTANTHAHIEVNQAHNFHVRNNLLVALLYIFHVLCVCDSWDLVGSCTTCKTSIFLHLVSILLCFIWYNIQAKQCHSLNMQILHNVTI